MSVVRAAPAWTFPDAKVATPEDASSAAAPALANASASRPVAAAALRTLRRVSSEDDFRGQTECG